MRSILHSDLNAFYASVEMLYHPELRGYPMAVCGDPAKRHGIILAKNEQAKHCGVQTGETLWQARQKCPDLVLTPAHGYLYVRYAKLIRDIYEQYTNRVQSYGPDECWLDVTAERESPFHIAKAIQTQIREETGLTVSIGVSFNKVLAKLGSDLKKPDAITVIGPDDLRTKVWPLPLGNMLFAGPRTIKKLSRINIRTIGDLARCEPDYIDRLLGKNGLQLWHYAWGRDDSEVKPSDEAEPVRSVGNRVTLPRDIYHREEVKSTFLSLADKVAGRLRRAEMVCRGIQIWVRDCELVSFERQCALDVPTCVTKYLYEAAMRLFDKMRCQRPIRSLGLRAIRLSERTAERQCSFLNLNREEMIWRSVEESIDRLRARYGNDIVTRAYIRQMNAGDHAVTSELYRNKGRKLDGIAVMPRGFRAHLD